MPSNPHDLEKTTWIINIIVYFPVCSIISPESITSDDIQHGYGSNRERTSGRGFAALGPNGTKVLRHRPAPLHGPAHWSNRVLVSIWPAGLPKVSWRSSWYPSSLHVQRTLSWRNGRLFPRPRSWPATLLHVDGKLQQNTLMSSFISTELIKLDADYKPGDATYA